MNKNARRISERREREYEGIEKESLGRTVKSEGNGKLL